MHKSQRMCQRFKSVSASCKSHCHENVTPIAANCEQNWGREGEAALLGFITRPRLEFSAFRADHATGNCYRMFRILGAKTNTAKY